MKNVKIILDSNKEINVNGLFYIYNSKYYFIYTLGELDENGYVKLYFVQVCKEIQNTPNGPVDTGYMIGVQIGDSEEWKKVQESITKIVDDKKNGTQNTEIQYLDVNMLVKLKVVSNNKFKLMKHIVEENFKIILPQSSSNQTNGSVDISNNNVNVQPVTPIEPVPTEQTINDINLENQGFQLSNEMTDTGIGDVIIDYRSKFFEEQEKNKLLEEEIRSLNEKLVNIKNIIG